jgi:hypothetical protein
MRSKTNAAIHAILAENNVKHRRAELVYSFSERTNSLAALTDDEAEAFKKWLQVTYPAKKTQPKGESPQKSNWNDPACAKLRKRLIAMSFSIGEDTEFVKAWCEKYGAFGVKKKFNEYNQRELIALCEKFQSHVINNRIRANGQ